MDKVLQSNYETVMDILKKAYSFRHARNVLEYDMQTISPSKGMAEQGETTAFIANEAYKLITSEEFIKAAEYCYEHRFGSGTEEAPAEDGLSLPARVLMESLHRDYAKIKNVTPEKNMEWELLTNNSYVKWLEAKEAKDFSVFAPTFDRVRAMNFERVSLRDEKKDIPYNDLLDDYERGITVADLDEWFGACKERLIPLVEKVKNSKKVIRTDFLSKPVEIYRQEEIAKYLLQAMDFDFSRGAFTTTEHPFMMGIAKNDIRVTTHYRLNNFVSSMYSIIHEGGHALFGQLQPAENYDYYLDDNMTMGMHESVSRFYENVIGRSRPFIRMVLPKLREITGGILDDVSEEEMYEAVNFAEPSLVRIESDELTYTLHIIIRYELEKGIMDGSLSTADIPKAWADKYEEYLGVRPENDADGCLQDVHWTWGYGYFPTYALGNMYNAMYYNRMIREVDLEKVMESGSLKDLNSWMKEHVFANACYSTPKEWIREITGREITPDDFLTNMENKYGEIYL